MKDNSFAFGSWVYNPLSDFTPEEVDTWKEFGLNVTVTPMLQYGRDDLKTMIPFLDKAAEAGIRLIVFIGGLSYGDLAHIGEEKYRERFTEVYNLYKGHPALEGFVIGDEPNGIKSMDATKAAVRIQLEVAPELDPYINFQGSTYARSNNFREGETYEEWFHNFVKETGVRKICFDTYNSTINYEGIPWQLMEIREMVSVCEKEGVEAWVTLLCSGHLAYHAPSEYEQCMQVHSAAALGCKGVTWFRMYDRDIAPEYSGSPIDEFGNRTEAFNGMMRVMRRFSLQYGEIFMKLKRTKTYRIGKKDGGYPEFVEGCHDVIKSIDCLDDLIVSFFEDPDGIEYMVLVNLSLDIRYAALTINLYEGKGSLFISILNGKNEEELGTGSAADGQYLRPGELRLYRVEKV